jgi:hypothetical protein
MKNHIENIRKYVKKQGYIPNSEQIRLAINKVCPSGENILENKAEIIAEVVNYCQTNSIDTNHNSVGSAAMEPENISNQINKNISNSIIISPEEKCAAIASQSTSLNVQLSENETLEIYSKIPDYFADYESFTDSVITSLKDFIDNKFNHQESNNTIEELRRHIASRQAKLDQKLASGISSIGEDFEHYRLNIKSSQARILALFKTST